MQARVRWLDIWTTDIRPRWDRANKTEAVRDEDLN
jgi:hypothetical protein